MDAWTLTVFLVGVLLGSYVQSVTGFAMGMILIALVTSTQTLGVPVAAAVVSLLSLVNVLMAIRGHVRAIERRLFIGLAVGQLPAIWVGVWLLDRLHGNERWLLELALGAFIVFGSLSMLIRPRPRRDVSPPLACVGARLAAGLFGGLFSASGPIMGWFTYRQPLGVNVIRATLLGSFILTTSVRTAIVGVQGALTAEVWILAAVGMPGVVFGTWAGGRFRPPLSDSGMKRLAFGLLLSLGAWILVRAALSF